MYATDFMFDTQTASDFGLIICSFDGNFESVTGGDIEVNSVLSPKSDTFTFYSAQYNTPLSWSFSVMKDPCKYNEDIYLTQEHIQNISKWLLRRDGYHWFCFIDDEDAIWHKVYINMLPHQHNGKTIGFDLTVTSNCGYGFSSPISATQTLSKTSPVKILINSDIPTYILPDIILYTPAPCYISNQNDITHNISSGKELRILKGGRYIFRPSLDLVTGLTNPDDFNWNFLRLIDNVNIIETDSVQDINITFKYREPRRVLA